uniref:Uncharacterized protein n=1 Tax=Otus sunia TaxID=257818 RepID=A0A8C8BEK7_9STRI
ISSVRQAHQIYIARITEWKKVTVLFCLDWKGCVVRRFWKIFSRGISQATPPILIFLSSISLYLVLMEEQSQCRKQMGCLLQPALRPESIMMSRCHSCDGVVSSVSLTVICGGVFWVCLCCFFFK